MSKPSTMSRMESMAEREEGVHLQALALGLGLGLGFLYLARPQSLTPLKPLSAAVKLAHAALSASHPHRALLLASKAVVKARRKLRPQPSSPPSPARLKACVAAANLFRYSNTYFLGNRLLEAGLFVGGYKFLKNSLRVAEGFVGIRLDSALKSGVEVVGVSVKAASLAAEVERRVLLKKLEWSRRHGVWFSRTGESRYTVRLCSDSRLGFGHCRYKSLRCSPAKCLVMCGRDVDDGGNVDKCLARLLSLGIPIYGESIAQDLL